MNRVTQLDPAQTTGKTKLLFDGEQNSLGIVPNLFRLLGTAPAALEGYFSFSTALADGSLNAASWQALLARCTGPSWSDSGDTRGTMRRPLYRAPVAGYRLRAQVMDYN